MLVDTKNVCAHILNIYTYIFILVYLMDIGDIFSGPPLVVKSIYKDP